MFIDELNARLHPLLVRNIILTFLSPEINTRNAQLVFTTHDIWQFSNELLRRDEIWMVNKNQDGGTCKEGSGNDRAGVTISDSGRNIPRMTVIFV